MIVRFGGPVFWTFIEYVWLFLASLSILGAVSEYRRTSAGDELPMARASMTWRWERAVKSADDGFSHGGPAFPTGLERRARERGYL